jgi:hypothetical protein
MASEPKLGGALLFVGVDWAEDHDVEVVGDTGRVLARRRLPEGPGGLPGCTP